jgi:hypothetical protein
MPEEKEELRIEAALKTLLVEMVRIDFEREPNPNASLLGTPFVLPKKIPTMEDVLVSRVIDEPIRGALKNAVRLLGERLFDLGGVDLMSDVLERIGEDPKNGGRYLSIGDHAWDCIGDNKRGHWFC